LPSATLGRRGMSRTDTRGCHLFFYRKGGVFMDVEVISNLFSNLAVPVACLIATFWLWNKEREDHKAETRELTQAIQNNTVVVQKLVDKLNEEKS